jgi:hypothetical protein
MGFASHRGPWRLGTVLEGSTKNAGVTIVSQSNTIAYTDTTAKDLFILPAGAQVLAVYVDVLTAFNSSGTDLLDIGKTGTANFFVNDQDVSATGHFVSTLVAGNLATIVNIGTSDVTVIGTFVQSVADADAGSARVTFVYAVKDASGNENPTSV